MIDYIARDDEVSFKGMFQTNQVYKEISKWAKKHGYFVDETAYKCERDGGSENLTIVLDLWTKVSDYTKLKLEVLVQTTDVKNKKFKNKVVQEGEVTITINSVMKRDYEDVWSRKQFTKFFREFFDKFIAPNRFQEDAEQAKKDTKSLKKHLKDFLNVPILKK